MTATKVAYIIGMAAALTGVGVAFLGNPAAAVLLWLVAILFLVTGSVINERI